jgi:ankyrin repeat protein
VVEYLLGEEGFEAHLRYVNSRGENVIHLASKTCNPAIFRLLVPRLQDSMHQTDIQGDTALMRIIKSHLDSKFRCESARILLLSQAYAAWDSYSGDEQHDPLHMAVRLGDIDMCRLLICDGEVNPHSALTRGDDGQLVLKDKPSRNEENILQLLRTYASCD